MTSTPLISSVGDLRRAHGWSQSRLGALAGITRQSLAAIESGRSVPSTEVALRLAGALDVQVEELFRLDDPVPGDEIVDAAGIGPPLPGRVRVARVGGRRLAYGLRSAAPGAGTLADGEATPLPEGRARLRPLPSRPPEAHLVVAGCDPAFGLVQERLKRKHGWEVLRLTAGSRAALEALAREEVHVAGLHLRDPATGTYNDPWIRETVPFPVTRISFAVWQQALLLAPGNPLDIEDLRDLARSDVRFVNREPGSGSRMLVEHELGERGIPGDAVPGFHRTAASGHEAAAGIVAAGAADAAVAIRAVADAHGLHALPVAEEPYELVIPSHFLELPAIEALLGLLRSPALARQVETLGGYDTRGMGKQA